MPKSVIAVLVIWNLIILHGLCGEVHKISEQPANILVDYFAYRHVSIIYFRVPESAVTAIFKFTAKEEKTGGVGSCSARNVSLYLKPGSLPLVSPDNSIIAAKLLEGRQQPHNLEFSSDDKSHTLSFESPVAGDWFAIGFRSWFDPNKEKIRQQGLGASCETILNAELSVETAENTSFIADRATHSTRLSSTNDSAVMRFLIPEAYETATFSVSSSCASDCEFALNVTAREQLAHLIVNSSKTSVPFTAWANDFHYVTLRLLSGNSTDVSVSLHQTKQASSKVEIIKLIRKSFPDFFLYDYEHVLGNSTKSSPLNLTVGTLSVLAFDVGAIHDVGGTLSVGLKLPDDVKSKSVIVVGCISLGYYENVTEAGSCSGNGRIHAASLNVNKTAPSFIHIPYPEPGTWHLSLKAFCANGTCDCMENCTTSVCEICECMDECSMRIETNVASSPCVEGRCGSNGRCVHYMSGGFVFSACHCSGGYSGWDCADDTYVLGKGEMLLSLLLLTLSNLAFIGSIYFAIRRKYYTEAIAYSAVLFFSSFYHACEAGGDIYNVCIMRLSVLQFCDFFNALLSIWVTLVAMAALSPRITAFCQMAGAVLLAMAAELDRTALWVFLMPAITGSALVGVSWGMRCKGLRGFRYPAKPYKMIFLPAGLGLVSFGLICFAFLQTQQNYFIVHSLWHMCVAGGVMLLLPYRPYMQ